MASSSTKRVVEFSKNLEVGPSRSEVSWTSETVKYAHVIDLVNRCCSQLLPQGCRRAEKLHMIMQCMAEYESGFTESGNCHNSALAGARIKAEQMATSILHSSTHRENVAGLTNLITSSTPLLLASTRKI